MSVFRAFMERERRREAEQRAAEAEHAIGMQFERQERIEREIERMRLAVMAITELACEKLGISQDDVMARIEEINLRDGKLDGRYVDPVEQCSGCGRERHPARTRCLYCGAAYED